MTLSGRPRTTDAEKANVGLLENDETKSEKIMEELGRLADEMAE